MVVINLYGILNSMWINHTLPKNIRTFQDNSLISLTHKLWSQCQEYHFSAIIIVCPHIFLKSSCLILYVYFSSGGGQAPEADTCTGLSTRTHRAPREDHTPEGGRWHRGGAFWRRWRNTYYSLMLLRIILLKKVCRRFVVPFHLDASQKMPIHSNWWPPTSAVPLRFFSLLGEDYPDVRQPPLFGSFSSGTLNTGRKSHLLPRGLPLTTPPTMPWSALRTVEIDVVYVLSLYQYFFYNISNIN